MFFVGLSFVTDIPIDTFTMNDILSSLLISAPIVLVLLGISALTIVNKEQSEENEEIRKFQRLVVKPLSIISGAYLLAAIFYPQISSPEFIFPAIAIMIFSIAKSDTTRKIEYICLFIIVIATFVSKWM